MDRDREDLLALLDLVEDGDLGDFPDCESELSATRRVARELAAATRAALAARPQLEQVGWYTPGVGDGPNIGGLIDGKFDDDDEAVYRTVTVAVAVAGSATPTSAAPRGMAASGPRGELSWYLHTYPGAPRGAARGRHATPEGGPVRVWVVSVECGLNGHSVLRVQTEEPSDEELAAVGDELVPGASYKWSAVTGFGGAQAWHGELTE